MRLTKEEAGGRVTAPTGEAVSRAAAARPPMVLEAEAQSDPKRWLVLGGMCFALFRAMLDNTVVNVAVPTTRKGLGAGISEIQWIVDGYTLLFAALMLTGGTVADIWGRKRTFILGLLV